MKKALAALGFVSVLWAIVSLFPTVAQVPQFPQNLPANTVVGRTGISAGPAQAIPFAQLTALINGSQPTVPVLYATAFGVRADGLTDNSVTMQNAVSACATANPISGQTGAILLLPPGTIVINTTLTSSAACAIIGAGNGGGFSTADTGGTVIQQNTIADDTFLFTTTNGVVLRDFAIVYGNGAQGTGAAIHIRPAVSPGANPNRDSRIDSVRVWGGGFGIYCDSCANFSFNNNHIMNFATDGIYIPHNAADPDEGDALLAGNTIWDFNVTSGDAGIRLDPAGGVQIIGNKLLGGNYGVRLTVSQGPTGTLLMNNNSVEQFNFIGVRVEQSVAGKTYGFIDIYGNEFQANLATTIQSAITIAAGSAQFISQINIHDNIIILATSTFNPVTCINVNDGDQVTIHDNNCNLNSLANSVGYGVGGNATNVQLSENLVKNFGASKYSFSVATRIIDHPGFTFGAVPTSNISNGSQTFLSDGTHNTSPCTGGGTGAMAFRENGAWNCF